MVTETTRIVGKNLISSSMCFWVMKSIVLSRCGESIPKATLLLVISRKAPNKGIVEWTVNDLVSIAHVFIQL